MSVSIEDTGAFNLKMDWNAHSVELKYDTEKFAADMDRNLDHLRRRIGWCVEYSEALESLVPIEGKEMSVSREKTPAFDLKMDWDLRTIQMKYDPIQFSRDMGGNLEYLKQRIQWCIGHTIHNEGK